jgi:hypothetical protein
MMDNQRHTLLERVAVAGHLMHRWVYEEKDAQES